MLLWHLSLLVVDRCCWWIVCLLTVFNGPYDAYTPTPSCICFDCCCCKWIVVGGSLLLLDHYFWMIVAVDWSLFLVDHCCCWWIIVVGGSLLLTVQMTFTHRHLPGSANRLNLEPQDAAVKILDHFVFIIGDCGKAFDDTCLKLSIKFTVQCTIYFSGERKGKAGGNFGAGIHWG